MNLKKLALEFRTEARAYGFTEAFHAFLEADHHQKPIVIRPLDVSQRGFGFICGENLAIGPYWLHLGKHKFRVEVMYCHSHLGIETLFRCGLFAREADVDLVESCLGQGFIRLEEAERA